MGFWAKKDGGEVATGAVYRRTVAGKVVDTAQVLALSEDCAGIRHVRFSVHHERTEAADELRTLALAAFREIFTERAPV